MAIQTIHINDADDADGPQLLEALVSQGLGTLSVPNSIAFPDKQPDGFGMLKDVPPDPAIIERVVEYLQKVSPRVPSMEKLREQIKPPAPAASPSEPLAAATPGNAGMDSQPPSPMPTPSEPLAAATPPASRRPGGMAGPPPSASSPPASPAAPTSQPATRDIGIPISAFGVGGDVTPPATPRDVAFAPGNAPTPAMARTEGDLPTPATPRDTEPLEAAAKLGEKFEALGKAVDDVTAKLGKAGDAVDEDAGKRSGRAKAAGEGPAVPGGVPSGRQPSLAVPNDQEPPAVAGPMPASQPGGFVPASQQPTRPASTGGASSVPPQPPARGGGRRPPVKVGGQSPPPTPPSGGQPPTPQQPKKKPGAFTTAIRRGTGGAARAIAGGAGAPAVALSALTAAAGPAALAVGAMTGAAKSFFGAANKAADTAFGKAGATTGAMVQAQFREMQGSISRSQMLDKNLSQFINLQSDLSESFATFQTHVLDALLEKFLPLMEDAVNVAKNSFKIFLNIGQIFDVIQAEIASGRFTGSITSFKDLLKKIKDTVGSIESLMRGEPQNIGLDLLFAESDDFFNQRSIRELLDLPDVSN